MPAFNPQADAAHHLPVGQAHVESCGLAAVVFRRVPVDPGDGRAFRVGMWDVEGVAGYLRDVDEPFHRQRIPRHEAVQD